MPVDDIVIVTTGTEAFEVEEESRWAEASINAAEEDREESNRSSFVGGEVSDIGLLI